MKLPRFLLASLIVGGLAATPSMSQTPDPSAPPPRDPTTTSDPYSGSPNRDMGDDDDGFDLGWLGLLGLAGLAGLRRRHNRDGDVVDRTTPSGRI